MKRVAMHVASLAALCLVFLAAAGCSKKQESAPVALPPPLPAAEAERGQEACAAYVARVCACAQAKPDDTDLADECHMAPAKSKSLDMVIEVNSTSESVDERVKTERTARRIVASCIEEQSKLDSRGCRASPGVQK